MRRIPLTQGKFALVDDEDYERVSQFKWRYCPDYRNPKTIGKAVRTVRIVGKRTTEHMSRFILRLKPGEPDADHRDGNGLDNRRNNLRVCKTPFQNGQNRTIQTHSTPYKGVHALKSANTYQSHINVNGKRIYLGSFRTPEEAAYAYDLSAMHFFGEFARTNQQMGVL